MLTYTFQVLKRSFAPHKFGDVPLSWTTPLRFVVRFLLFSAALVLFFPSLTFSIFFLTKLCYNVNTKHQLTITF